MFNTPFLLSSSVIALISLNTLLFPAVKDPSSLFNSFVNTSALLVKNFTPAGLFKEELTNIVRNMEEVPMLFRGKKIETFVIPPSLGTFSLRLIFGDGIDKPRLIVTGVQVKPNDIANDQFNNSIFNVPTAHQIDVKKITITFNDNRLR